jgi:hypothetical protein
LHSHFFVPALQNPLPVQGGLHMPLVPMQVGPLKPATQ